MDRGVFGHKTPRPTLSESKFGTRSKSEFGPEFVHEFDIAYGMVPEDDIGIRLSLTPHVRSDFFDYQFIINPLVTVFSE